MKLSAMICGICVMAAGFARATEVPAPQARPIRVLLTYGGHGFEEKEFYAMWDALPGISYSKCELPRQANMLKPGLEKQYDVLVMYDMAKAWNTRAGRELRRPHQGRHAVRLTPPQPLLAPMMRDFHRIIGGQYVHKPTVIEGKEYAPCTYKHGQQLEVKVADKEHPITRGLADFKIKDKAYHGFWVSPKAHVLLTVNHPLCNRDVCWTTEFGKARVFYMMLGTIILRGRIRCTRDCSGRGIGWVMAGKEVAVSK